MRLQRKVALITGAGSGIGRATALRFAAEGAQIVAVDIAGSVDDTVAEVLVADGDAIAVRADVSSESDVAAAFGRAEEHYGGLDVAFNNAGIMLDDDTDAVATGDDTIDRTFDVNIKGVLYGCRYAVEAMRRRGGGSIINTASFVASVGAATPQIAYTASKGAVLALTRELAVVSCPGEHPRQFALAGPAAHRDADVVSRHAREAPATPGARADGTLRRSRRDGLRSPVPRLRRRVLYDGRRPARRRRPHCRLRHTGVARSRTTSGGRGFSHPGGPTRQRAWRK